MTDALVALAAVALPAELTYRDALMPELRRQSGTRDGLVMDKWFIPGDQPGGRCAPAKSAACWKHRSFTMSSRTACVPGLARLPAATRPRSTRKDGSGLSVSLVEMLTELNSP